MKWDTTISIHQLMIIRNIIELVMAYNTDFRIELNSWPVVILFIKIVVLEISKPQCLFPVQFALLLFSSGLTDATQSKVSVGSIFISIITVGAEVTDPFVIKLFGRLYCQDLFSLSGCL